MFEKVLVIDGKGHLLGRLASVVAKEILNGQRVVVVRCEGIEVSGTFERNFKKYTSYLAKRKNINPSKGPFHQSSPSLQFWRVVKGMIPRKTSRGEAAFRRLKVFEGVPPPYDKMKRMVLPDALRVLRLRPGRRFTDLAAVGSAFGWRHEAVVERLEAKRKARSGVYYRAKKALVASRKAAAAKADLTPVAGLAQYGF